MCSMCSQLMRSRNPLTREEGGRYHVCVIVSPNMFDGRCTRSHWVNLFRLRRPKTNARSFVISLFDATRLWSLGARQIADIRANPKLVSLGVKSGIAATLAAVVCVLEDPIPDLSEIGIWAVVTVDLVFEPTVGSSLGKGVNRTAGTLLAAVLAFGVNHATPHLGDVKPLFLAILVFLGSVIPTYYRYRPPFKDTWSYSFLMMSLTFHILILSGYRHEEKFYYPLARLVMIMLGFTSVGLVHIFILPTYSGDLLHKLVVSRLRLVATELDRCGENCVLENSSTGSVMTVCSDILFCQADVVKHLSAIQFEPPHGKFFHGYPWKAYCQVLASLQNLALTVITMDSSRHAVFQGYTSLEQDLGAEMRNLLHECSRVVMMLAVSMENFIWDGRPALALLHTQNDLLKEKALHSLQLLVHLKAVAEVESACDTPCSCSHMSVSPTAWTTDFKVMEGLLSPRYSTRMEHLRQAKCLHGSKSGGHGQQL
ncbi:unnamed protein product [Closterium sp. Yama58-4]|nr:unnamed protein product [Closterium sp. Yama58-4]